MLVKILSRLGHDWSKEKEKEEKKEGEQFQVNRLIWMWL